MKLNRKQLRYLIESALIEASGPNRSTFHRRLASKIENKDKSKAEKVMYQISGADWNSGYDVEIVVQDEKATGVAKLTPIGLFINKFAPGSGTKYGVKISGFSQQKEANNFAEIVRNELGIKAVSLKDVMTVIVDPAQKSSAAVSQSRMMGTEYKL